MRDEFLDRKVINSIRQLSDTYEVFICNVELNDTDKISHIFDKVDSVAKYMNVKCIVHAKVDIDTNISKVYVTKCPEGMTSHDVIKLLSDSNANTKNYQTVTKSTFDKVKDILFKRYITSKLKKLNCDAPEIELCKIASTDINKRTELFDIVNEYKRETGYSIIVIDVDEVVENGVEKIKYSALFYDVDESDTITVIDNEPSSNVIPFVPKAKR